MKSRSDKQNAWVRFSDPLAAFEELEYLVKETGLSHRLFRNRKGQYVVIGNSYHPKKSTLVAELNCRNIHGNEMINKNRGEKMRQYKIGRKQEKISGLYQYTAPSRGKKRERK